MESGALISVVTPLFNKGHCIERALRSVTDQTVPCGEIIVVDDGSTDGGGQVVEQMGDRRIRLFRQANQGPSAARNKGIEEARGELIAFLDADDEWKPWFLETILNLKAKHPEAGAYATSYEIHEPDGRVRIPSFREIPPTPWEGIIPNFFRSAIGNNPMWTSAVVIPTEVFDQVGRFVLCSGIGEDVELWGRIALHYPIAFSRRVSAVYHREAENRCCETVFTHVFPSDDFERTMRSPEVPRHLLPDVEEFVALQKLMAASRHIVNGQSELARSILKGCKTRRLRKQKLWWWLWSWLPTGWVKLAWRSKQWFQKHLRQWDRSPCPHR